MYELTIRAETLAELSGRIRALAVEFGASPANIPAPLYESTVTTPLRTAPPEPLLPPSRAEVLSEVVGAGIPYEQVRSAILRVAAKRGREGVDQLLTQFGATTNAKEIAPERYPEVLSAVDALLSD